jgi:hypothetical protein
MDTRKPLDASTPNGLYEESGSPYTKQKGLIMSTNLAQVLESLKSEIKVDYNGRGFVSIRGAARLADVSHVALLKAFSSGNNSESKLAQSLTNKGFNLVTFQSKGIPDKALACILEYYTFDAGKRCTELAELSYRTFATIGVRSWLQKSVGYLETVQPCLETVQEVAPQLEPAQLSDTQREYAKVLLLKDKQRNLFKRFLKYCDGQPRTTGFFGSGHSFVRRLDVLDVYGKKGQKYLTKPEIIKLFRSAEAAGLGIVETELNRNITIYTFKPFLTAHSLN